MSNVGGAAGSGMTSASLFERLRDRNQLMTDLAESDETPAGSDLLAPSLKGRKVLEGVGTGKGSGITRGGGLEVASTSLS